MKLFRKKPVIVEAMRYGHCTDVDLLCWISSGGVLVVSVVEGGKRWLEIPTLEGLMKAHDGDWIIKGVKGEFYPCKPDIFALTYEPVPEGEEAERED